MEWFAFLIYLLNALFSSVVLWFTIKVGFRNAIPYELESAELSAKKADALIAANSKTGLFWNFSSVLIIIPTFILLLGISVRHLPLHNPVTYTLGGALLLIWCIALWSGMLSFPQQTKTSAPAMPDDLSENGEPNPAVPELTDSKETP